MENAFLALQLRFYNNIKSKILNDKNMADL